MKFTDAKLGFLPVRLAPSNDKHRSKGTVLVLYTTDDSGQTWKRDRALTDADIGPLDHVIDIVTLLGAEEWSWSQRLATKCISTGSR
jgi:hypothetical protein